jgi:hypothetical protein
MSSPDHAGRKPVVSNLSRDNRSVEAHVAPPTLPKFSIWQAVRGLLRRRVLLCALAVLAVVIVIAASLPAVAQVPVERIGEPPQPSPTAIPLKPPCQTARCVHLPIVKRGAR